MGREVAVSGTAAGWDLPGSLLFNQACTSQPICPLPPVICPCRGALMPVATIHLLIHKF